MDLLYFKGRRVYVSLCVNLVCTVAVVVATDCYAACVGFIIVLFRGCFFGALSLIIKIMNTTRITFHLFSLYANNTKAISIKIRALAGIEIKIEGPTQWDMFNDDYDHRTRTIKSPDKVKLRSTSSWRWTESTQMMSLIIIIV